MGKCASKDVVNGQIVPETELDAGSPMFAPEAPPAGGETATAGGEVTFKGYAPAPVDPVAAALPSDQTAAPRGHSVDFAAGAQYTGYPMRNTTATSHVKTEHIGSSQLFNTLEEAEEAARKQNQAWGVDHLPYDPKASQAQYGNTYASAFPPTSSVYQQPAPTDPRPVAPEQPTTAPEQYHQPRYDSARPAEPTYHPAPEPRLSGAHAAQVEPQRSSGAFAGHQQPPSAAVEYESPAAVPVVVDPLAQQQPEHPATGMPAEPLTGAAPVTVPVEEELKPASEETPSKKKKKKSKKSSKGKNWAWF